MAIKIKGHQVLELAAKDIAKATKLAINKATNSTVVEVKRIIRAKYNVQLKELSPESKHGIKIIPAKSNGMTTKLVIPHERLGLIYFKAKATKAKGVQVEIKKGKKTFIKNAFILKVASKLDEQTGQMIDKYQVFKRYGEKVIPVKNLDKARKTKAGKLIKRQRIRKLTAFSIAELFTGKRGKDLQQNMETILTKKFAVELVRASKYLIQKR